MAIALATAAIAPAPVRADDAGEPVLGTTPASADTARFVLFPRGEIFRPLLADPKAEGSFLSYVNNGRTPGSFGTHIGSVGIGDQLGVVRFRSTSRNHSFQAGVAGNVYSQFNIGTSPTGLVNADYSLGIPLSYRSGRFSSRLRLYHQSSHLSDGIVVPGRLPHENASFESADLVLAMTSGELRAYGGGEYRMEGRHLEHPSWVAHWGFELRQRDPLARSGGLARTRLVAGLDVKSYQESYWSRCWSGRAGLEIGPARDGGRSWTLLAEYLEGPSPFGQFLTERISYVGFGLHLGP